MAVYHGKDANFEIDSNDLSQYTTDVEIAFSIGTAESSAKGVDYQSFVEGQHGATINISGRWDDTATTGPDAVLDGLRGGGAVSFQVGPGGDASGKVIYSGNCIMTSYSASAPLAGVTDFSASFQTTGAVTRSTVGA